MKRSVPWVGTAVIFGLCALAFILTSIPVVANGTRIKDDAPVADNCANEDGALDDASFVIATRPQAGDRVDSGFAVSGCSRTFESTVLWRLIGFDGTELASGSTLGGGVDGPGSFSFTVSYSVDEREIGHLEVFEEDVSDGEGFPPGRTVLPLVLRP